MTLNAILDLIDEVASEKLMAEVVLAETQFICDWRARMDDSHDTMQGDQETSVDSISSV